MNNQEKEIFRETDIRPDEMIEKQEAYIEADREKLLRQEKDFVEISCPACNSGGSELIFVKNGLRYVTCKACKTLYVNPRPTAEILGKFYSESAVYEYWNKSIYPASDNARREFVFRPRVEKIVNFCKKYGLENVAMMEIGAGYGTFCDEARTSGFFKDVIAIEPTRAGAESCRKKKINVLEQPIEAVSLDSSVIDVIASFEVIEHLFSPKELLINCSRLLRKGGLVVFSCPNIVGFDNLVLGSASPTIDHEHLNYFNPHSLEHLVTTCGFNVLEILTPGKLDAEIVRKQVLKGNYTLDDQSFLHHILIERWDELGLNFQNFLADNRLSSHMWIVASKKG